MKLSDKVSTIKYISEKYEKLLNTLGIFNLKDLLTYFPYRYTDSSDSKLIKDILIDNQIDQNHLLKVKISNFKSNFIPGGRTIQSALVEDSTGSLKVMWFNQRYLSRVFKDYSEYLIYGKLAKKGNNFVFYPSNFEEIIPEEESNHLGRIAPEYNLTSGVTKKWLRNRIKSILDDIESIDIPDELNLNLKSDLKEIHFPNSKESLANAQKNLSIYELINIQLKVLKRKAKFKKFRSIQIPYKESAKVVGQYLGTIPFKATDDQLKVIDNLLKSLENKQPINELIQGDVGSGKTLVAMALSAVFAKHGFQSVVLAPTTILAKQHYTNFKKNLEQFGITVELVSSENKESQTADILVGTSAVLARKVNLVQKLALVIVDEQHRFGVRQREELLEPFNESLDKFLPHFINMTATPIPRTIAQAFFGDVDISFIKSKPFGRKEIKTRVLDSKKRKDAIEWIKEEVENGNQCYWVCPLVNESEKVEAKSAKATFEKLKKYFKETEIGLLHGQMKENEKTEVMKKFKENEYKVLVATSVIEVGIDVPNTTIIVIENAERFGLAQLHQIRGRVGRSDKESWCFIFTESGIPQQTIDKLNFFASNSDGLKIAEYDLKSRGPGEIYGVRQSGIPDLKIARLDDIELINISKELAIKLYNQGIRKIEIYE